MGAEAREKFIAGYEAYFGPLFTKNMLPRTKALWAEFMDRIPDELIEPLIQSVSDGWKNDFRKPQLSDFSRALKPMMADRYRARHADPEVKCGLCNGTGYMPFVFSMDEFSAERQFTIGFRSKAVPYRAVIACLCRAGSRQLRYHPQTTVQQQELVRDWVRQTREEAKMNSMDLDTYILREIKRMHGALLGQRLRLGEITLRSVELEEIVASGPLPGPATGLPEAGEEAK
jgi:hypothetical protein